MTELAFTKSFLSLLDSRPIKLSADHVFDPETVGLRIPYTLPRLGPNHPSMPPKTRKRTTIPGLSKSITVHLKSSRNPSLHHTLSNAPLSTTTVEDLKSAVRDRLVDNEGNRVALDKIKILYRRKPVSGSNKTVAGVLEDEPELLSGGKDVEFGVMVMGGAGVRVVDIDVGDGQQVHVAAARDVTKPTGEEKLTEDDKGEGISKSTEEGLRSEIFWDDLQGFLAQRLKDETGARRLRALFQNAWTAR